MEAKMSKLLQFIFLIFFSQSIFCQSLAPEITSWMVNTTGVTGYNGFSANIQKVQYSAGSVYVSCSGIPGYPIGLWPDGNPSTPLVQNYIFKIPRTQQVKSIPKRKTSLGQIGVLKNGVPIYNALDARSYNNQGKWNQNAVVVEAKGFDAALGHPAPGGKYHHHQNPKSLYISDSTKHSSILGYSFDGYPIYGPYGYKNTDGTGGITRITSSYKYRSITTRTTLPDGTVLSTSEYGPVVSTTYPLGYYMEDFEYSAGYGLLDEYNGRTAKTPEYPNGIYAYYVTINSDGSSAYPFIIGPSYYGVIEVENLGAGRATINEPTTEYWPTSNVDKKLIPTKIILHQNYPNPFNPSTTIRFSIPTKEKILIRVIDLMGREVEILTNKIFEAGNHEIKFSPKSETSRIYFAQLTSGGKTFTTKMVFIK